MIRRTVAATLVACIAVGVPIFGGGCSLVFVRPPKKEESGRSEAAACTSNRTAPALDVVLSSLQAIRTVFALGLSDKDYQGMALTRDSDIALGLVFTTLFATSAVYGFTTTGTCREITGRAVNPYQRAPTRTTRGERLQEEAAEEVAVEARRRAKAAADANDAKAAGEAAKAGQPARTP